MADLAAGTFSAFTESSARYALTHACQRVSLPIGRVELIRMGSNAVFRINADTIGRVAPSLAAKPNAELQLAVSRWLRSIGYPATHAVDVEQPVEADGRVVTFWQSVAPETIYAPIDQVANLVRRLHGLPRPPIEIALPEIRPFGAPNDPFPRFKGLGDAAAAFLEARYAWSRATFARFSFPLPRGVIHGDANVGNVLVDTQGDAVLIDLDSFSIGPREWDLIQTALFADRFGWHTAEEYRTFVEVYGYDITQWEGYETLADMREVAMTAWLARKAATDEAAATEVHKRITAMRTGGSRCDWGAY